jgi:hypothetical protein
MYAMKRLLIAVTLCAVLSPRVGADGVAIYVRAGGDLQAAIDRARPGDRILLERGRRLPVRLP